MSESKTNRIRAAVIDEVVAKLRQRFDVSRGESADTWRDAFMGAIDAIECMRPATPGSGAGSSPESVYHSRDETRGMGGDP